jgi:hypothetical protein
MHRRFILLLGPLLGVMLGSSMPTAAQTHAPQIVRAQEQVAPIMGMVRTVSAPLLAVSLLPSEDPGKSAAHFTNLSAGAFERDQSLENLESLSPVREVKTSFLTRSSLPLVQLWGGRLRVEGFTSTIHMQNVQLGPSTAIGLQDLRPRGQDYPGGPPSVGFYGLSLSFHFGRNAQVERPTQIWRCVAKLVRAAR